MHDVGERIGPYEIVAQIGYGGMAEVYRAADHNLGREVALKLLAREISEDATFQKRFVREYRLAAAIHHPNIVPIYDAGEWEGQLFIAMPIVGDGNLAEIIKSDGTSAPRAGRSPSPARSHRRSTPRTPRGSSIAT